MEQTTCQSCNNAPASYVCTCGAVEAFLCLGCLDAHTDLPGQHSFKKIAASDQSRSSFAKQKTGFICTTCNSALATEVCSCVYPLLFICEDCKAIHISKDMYSDHTFLPLLLHSRVGNLEAWERLRDGLLHLGEVEDKCKECIREMSVCGEMIEKRYSELQRMLDDGKRVKLEQLARTKQVLISNLASVLQVTKANLLNDAYLPEPGLSTLIFKFLTSVSDESMVLFTTKKVEPDIPEAQMIIDLFGIVWESVIETPVQVSKRDHQKTTKKETCEDLLRAFKDSFSAEIRNLNFQSELESVKSESTRTHLAIELQRSLEQFAHEIALGNYRENVPGISLLPELQSNLQVTSLCSKLVGKAAWLSVGEMFFLPNKTETRAQSVLAHKKLVVELIESGLDSVYWKVQLMRANSSTEGTVEKLNQDIRVLEEAGRSSVQDTLLETKQPFSSLALSDHPIQSSVDHASRSNSLSLSHILEMKKFSLSEDNLRNIEKAILNTHESVHVFFKVLVTLLCKNIPFDTVERLVNELITTPVQMQFVPYANVECLTQTLRRYPKKGNWEFAAKASPYDRPEELASFLLDTGATRSTHFSVASVHTGNVDIFDCRGHVWNTIAYPQNIKVDSKSAYVWLDNGDLLVCGGVWLKSNFADTYQIMVNSQTTTRHPDMHIPRSAQGIILYFTSVYVFGGSSSKALKSCEKFSLSPPHWEELSAEMTAPRHGFNPCIYNHMVYLIGGNSPNGELFDPLEETFTPITFLLPEISNTCALVTGSDLVIITAQHIAKWSIRTKEPSPLSEHKKFCAWGNMPPVVYGSEVYLPMLDCVCLQKKRCVQKLDLKSGLIVGFER